MKKKVKAWAIVTNRGKIMGSNIEFGPNRNGRPEMTKYPAIYLLKVFAARRRSWFANPNEGKIVPIEITYEV